MRTVAEITGFKEPVLHGCMRKIFFSNFADCSSTNGRKPIKRMELLTALENDCYRIALKGELDASSSLLLDEALEKAIACSPRKVYVDCRELNYISSAGLGVLVSHLPNLAAGDIALVLYQMSPRVRDVFHVLGLEHFLTILPCHPDATYLPQTSGISL